MALAFRRWYAAWSSVIREIQGKLFKRCDFASFNKNRKLHALTSALGNFYHLAFFAAGKETPHFHHFLLYTYHCKPNYSNPCEASWPFDVRRQALAERGSARVQVAMATRENGLVGGSPLGHRDYFVTLTKPSA